jgi:tetratricopeptide (TPR) repeat protein
MIIATRIILLVTIFFSLATSAFAAPPAKKSPVSLEELQQQVDALKKNPGDHALREKIIKLAQTMKPAPAMPEDAERNMARGTAFAQKASDATGYKKAIAEFESAANAAPWLALAYYNLGVMQEKAGLFAESLQNFKFYVLAAPDAKNIRDVKNKIYALEVDVEDLQKAGKAAPSAAAVPAGATAAADAGAGKALAVTGKTSLDIEPEKQFIIIKMPPPEKKSKLPSFIGNWYFKDTLRGEEHTIHAFEIARNPAGDLVVNAPKRAADSTASVLAFEINDLNMKLQFRWKMRSAVGYWKTETYELKLSEDGKTLSGSHNQKSVGGRNVDLDRVLFRQ